MQVFEGCKGKQDLSQAATGEYQEFFKGKLKDYGVNSPSELDDAKKKEFFSEIEEEWDSETED